jgi:hypothetical protein
MNISFIDKFGATVWIESKDDFNWMIKKYIGGSSSGCFDELLKGYLTVSNSDGSYDDGYDKAVEDMMDYLRSL